MISHFVEALTSLALLASASAQTNVECIDRLGVPGSGPFARTAKSGGTVHAVITFLKNRPPQIEMTGSSDPSLKAEVQLFLQDSTFLSTCEGMKILLNFTFRLFGSASDSLYHRVYFSPPNSYLIEVMPAQGSVTRHPRGIEHYGPTN